MKNLIFFFLVLISLQLGSFQSLFSQNCHWAINCAKGDGDDFGTISMDASSNIYLTGLFSGPKGIFGNDTILPVGWLGSYLPMMFCKLNTSGSFQWVKGITIQGNPCNTIISSKVATNKSQNGAWFYGHVCGNLFLDSINLKSSTGQVFIARYDVAGHCVWAKEAGGQGNDYASQACIDKYGNTYIAGVVTDSAHFDEFTIVPGEFLAKYDADGNCVWAKNICDGSFNICGIAVNKDQLVIAGQSVATTPYSLAGILIDPSLSNIILSSFDTSGIVQWARPDGIGRGYYLTTIGFDSTQNFYLSGQCNNFIFGNDTIANTSSCSQLFIVKHDNLGNPIWARISSGENKVVPSQLNVGDDGNCYIIGRLEFYMIPNAATTFGSCYATIAEDPLNVEMFVVRYDASGNCLGVKHVPTDISGPNPSGGISVAQDSNGDCLVAGQFIQTTSFDTYILTSSGGRDIFIAKFDAFTGTGIEKRKIENQLVIYANPNDGKCSIILPDEFRHERHLKLSIYNSQGKTIEQVPVEIISEKISLNISAEAKGIYNVLLTNGTKSYSGKILRN
jgi:hypothetical protein